MLRIKEKDAVSALFELDTLEDTSAFGKAVSEVLTPGMALLMYGKLGAGKTTLVREICRSLGWYRTCSPSFSIVNEYAGARIPIAHADLYRVENADGRDFGFDDYLDEGWVLIVEWPERLINSDFIETWRVEITEARERRSIKITAYGPDSETALRRLEELL